MQVSLGQEYPVKIIYPEGFIIIMKIFLTKNIGGFKFENEEKNETKNENMYFTVSFNSNAGYYL